MFTKVYKEEDVRLRGCSYNVASVYFHLKNKRDYFKSKNNGTCYDLTKYISEYMGIPEITIKRAIATLKKIGLISTVIKGKVNHYSFPILDAIENGTEIPTTQEQQNSVQEDNYKNIEEDIDINKEKQVNTMETQQETEFYNYCEEVEKLLDSDDIITINNILKRGIDYMEFGKTEYEVFAKTGNTKIMEIINNYFNYNENDRARTDFLNYVSEYNKDYKESVYNKLNECEYDRYEYDAA